MPLNNGANPPGATEGKGSYVRFRPCLPQKLEIFDVRVPGRGPEAIQSEGSRARGA